MRIVDPIVTAERVAAPAAEADLLVPSDLWYFDGHFPGLPVVPGVVQIKWAIAIARRCLGVQDAFAGLEALKYQNVMGPGTRATLKLEHVAATGKLRFSFEAGQTRYSSGRVLLRPTAGTS